MSKGEEMDCKYQNYEIAKQADIYKIQNELHGFKYKYELDQSIQKYIYFYHFVTALFLMLSFVSLVRIHAKLNDIRDIKGRSAKVEVEEKK